MTQNPTPIHESVREYYAAQARSSGSCCGPDASSCCGPAQKNALYPAELITTLPEDVADFSLGCGDPISLAGLKPAETVLDLGSGGGLDCFLAARQVGNAGSVIGVDMTPEMLARARASAARMGVRNVEFRQGYLESLPVEDGCVDVVISNCVINLSPDKPAVFHEVFRVFETGRPGGRFGYCHERCFARISPKGYASLGSLCGRCIGYERLHAWTGRGRFHPDPGPAQGWQRKSDSHPSRRPTFFGHDHRPKAHLSALSQLIFLEELQA